MVQPSPRHFLQQYLFGYAKQLPQVHSTCSLQLMDLLLDYRSCLSGKILTMERTALRAQFTTNFTLVMRKIH